MLGPEMNAGLDAGSIQKICGAGYVSGPEFRENLTSLLAMSCYGGQDKTGPVRMSQGYSGLTSTIWGLARSARTRACEGQT